MNRRAAAVGSLVRAAIVACLVLCGLAPAGRAQDGATPAQRERWAAARAGLEGIGLAYRYGDAGAGHPSFKAESPERTGPGAATWSAHVTVHPGAHEAGAVHDGERLAFGQLTRSRTASAGVSAVSYLDRVEPAADAGVQYWQCTWKGHLVRDDVGVTWTAVLWSKAPVVWNDENALEAVHRSHEQEIDVWLARVHAALGTGGPALPAVEVLLFDGNPEHLPEGTELPVAPSAPPAERSLERAVRRVAGVAADGASLVVVRVEPRQHLQWVRFELTGDAPAGTLGPVNGAAGPVAAVVAQAYYSKYAFAVFRAPEELGAAFAAQRERRVRISVTVHAAAATPAVAGDGSVRLTLDGKPAPAIAKGEVDVRVVRPPVVLVHGTYSDPTDAWLTPYAAGEQPTKAVLEAAGFQVWCADYSATNGSSKGGPSRFHDNRNVVADAPGGIAEALRHVRGLCDAAACGRPHAAGEAFACCRADLVCHSMGGVLARVHARGFALDTSPPPEHFDAGRRACPGCWYHRPDNFRRGDIRRLVTLSSTHSGSDICRILNAYDSTLDPQERGRHLDARVRDLAALLRCGLLGVADAESGRLTGAFEDQIPFSDSLAKLGPTPVSMHAIACVARYRPPGSPGVHPTETFYRDRIFKVWEASLPSTLQLAFESLGQPNDARRLAAMRQMEIDLVASRGSGLSSDEAALLRLMIADGTEAFVDAAFGHRENDCTVRIDSSLAGLTDAHTTVVRGVWHSDAPRAPQVQRRMIELLTGPATAFAPSVPDSDQLRRLAIGRGVTDDSPSDVVELAAQRRERLLRKSASGGDDARKEAEALSGAGKYAEAAEAWSRVLAGDPDDAAARSSRGTARVWANDLAGAREDFELLARSPTADAATRRVHGSLEVAVGDARKAAAIADALLAKDPADALGLVLRGQALLRLGDTAAAADCLSRAAAAAPELKEGVYGQANAMLAAGVPALAEIQYLAVVWMDPKHPGAYWGLGHARARLGRTDLAIEAFEAHLRIDATSRFADDARTQIAALRGRR